MRSALAPAPTADLEQGETIRGRKPGDKVFNGRYELKRILGRGGMGVVWLAQDRELEHEVALKFLPEVMAYNEAAILELKRETKKALLLTHPHIVRIYSWERDAENAAVSMEYVDGQTLAALKAERESGCLEVADIREWVRQLCEALEYAHGKAKVVHRDLKPQNLMVNSKGDLKITDFGISRSLEESVSKTTRGGGFSGTLSYMSPQQLEGRMSEPSDDLYALGATIYELLTGKPPFHTGDIGKQITGKVPPSVADRRKELRIEGGADIPETWEKTVAACLGKEPGQRPTGAKAVWEGLMANHQGTKDAKEEKPESEGGRHRSTEKGADGEPVGEGGAGAKTAERPQSSGGKGRWLALAAMVVLVGLGAWWLGPGRKGAELSTSPKGMSNVVASPPVQAARAATGQVAQMPARSDEAQLRREGQAKAEIQREAAERAKQEVPKAAMGAAGSEAGEVMTNSIGMQLVWIAPGKFTMGSPANESGRYDDEGPQTEVTLTKGYWLGKYEVTQGEYEAVMGNNPSKWKGARLPVEQASWNDAVEYCRKLTERERSAGKLPAGYEYRLPTEAQWEYACRAGTKTRFSGGDFDGQLADAGWYGANSEIQTHPVGQKQPNALGLCDMHGNVKEWCYDWFGNYPGGSVTDPTGANSGSDRVYRGGSWIVGAKYCRAAIRFRGVPGSGSPDLGFRAALARVSAAEAVSQAKVDDKEVAVIPQATKSFTNSLGMVFVPVPGTQVLFSIWETRVKDYAAYAAANSGVDASWKDPVFQGKPVTPGPTHPVVDVSWNDAVAFCQWLTETERKAGRLGAGQEYRLPTDAEWSYAVGIGDRETGSTPKEKDGRLKDVYPWGTNLYLARVEGNYGSFMGEGRFERTSPAGSFKANQHGLFDMGGNVWEWCQDWYDSEQKYRVLRGSSWNGGTKLSSARDNGNPGRHSDERGFRVVLAAGGASPATGQVDRTPAQPEPERKLAEELNSLGNKTASVTTNGIGMELVWIAPGRFTMGSPAGEAGRYNDEGPQTAVTLTKGYWLGKYEVTQGEYEAVTGSNPSHFKGAALPVETVSWTEAVEFCRKLTERERSAGKLPAGYEYRLPTEAQWEYACRAGTTTRFSGGDADSQLGAVGWYYGNSGNQTHPVGQKQPNAWGPYDMHGNVWEWCSDWYGNYPGGSVTDPTGAGSGSFRVIRGGCWSYDAGYCRSAIRIGNDPGDRYHYLGFRAALAPVQ